MLLFFMSDMEEFNPRDRNLVYLHSEYMNHEKD